MSDIEHEYLWFVEYKHTEVKGLQGFIGNSGNIGNDFESMLFASYDEAVKAYNTAGYSLTYPGTYEVKLVESFTEYEDDGKQWIELWHQDTTQLEKTIEVICTD
jgi:hypothetical protein